LECFRGEVARSTQSAHEITVTAEVRFYAYVKFEARDGTSSTVGDPSAVTAEAHNCETEGTVQVLGRESPGIRCM